MSDEYKTFIKQVKNKKYMPISKFSALYKKHCKNVTITEKKNPQIIATPIT
jgi:hypothetical protein